MIKIIAKCTVKKEEVTKFIEITKPLIEASRQEEGCISYALHQDIKNSNILTFIEEWVDQEAIDCHNATPHFRAIVPTLGKLQEKPSEVNLYKEI